MKFTKHATARMKQRNITRGDVSLTVHTGVKMVNKHDSEKLTFVHNSLRVYVVTNKEADTVITVFKK